jgi:rubrerythrin
VQISTHELRALARDVDDMHHEAMRDFAEHTADLHADTARRSRRTFLSRAGVAGAAGALWGLTGSPIPGLSRLRAASARGSLTDTQIAGYAQSVELAAVQVYDGAAAMLSADVKPVGELFASHHRQHADAFGQVAGDDAVTAPNATLLAALGPTLQGITDQAGALTFARQVENQAAYTYAYALTVLQDPAFASATATILPIEAQHATVLSIALGQTDAGSLFPTGAFESATVGDGSDAKAGLDPTAFPAS